MRVQTKEQRVQKFLVKQMNKPGWDFSDAPDPRKEAMTDHKMQSIIWSLELGLISNQPTLRDVELVTKDLSCSARKMVPDAISDTTLDTELRRLDVRYLTEKLELQVRAMHRSKMLKPFGLPFGVVTVDGKNLATLSHNADGTGHVRTKDTEKWVKGNKRAQDRDDYYLMPALRATLTSAAAKPCIQQKRLPIGTGESTNCRDFINDLHRVYGRSGMFEVLDFDAGLISLATADAVNEMNYGYVFGLKGNQPELYAEATRLFQFKTFEEEPEIETDWEKRSGKQIRRRLWRTDKMRGYENSVGNWSHLRQTWLVRQETRYPEGKQEVEDRYFVSSLPWNRLRPHQILTLVRGHWGVENDTFNSLDLQWKEDSAPWCTKGRSVWALGVLRLMAYNVVQYIRKRRLRRKRQDGTMSELISWRRLFKIINRVFESDGVWEREAKATS